MLAEKSSGDERFSLPELTLINAIASSPSTRMAAKGATEGVGGGAPAPAAATPGGADEKKANEIDEMAEKVWEELRRRIEAARERNGDVCR
jgi:hypothetical protein